jgi:hypothetical protein
MMFIMNLNTDKFYQMFQFIQLLTHSLCVSSSMILIFFKIVNALNLSDVPKMFIYFSGDKNGFIIFSSIIVVGISLSKCF